MVASEQTVEKHVATEQLADVTDETIHKLGLAREKPGWQQLVMVPRGLYFAPHDDLPTATLHYVNDGCHGGGEYIAEGTLPAGEAVEVRAIAPTSSGLSIRTAGGSFGVLHDQLAQAGRLLQAPAPHEQIRFNAQLHRLLTDALKEGPAATISPAELAEMVGSGGEIKLSAADPILDARDVSGRGTRLPSAPFDTVTTDQLTLWLDSDDVIRVAFTPMYHGTEPVVVPLTSVEFHSRPPFSNATIAALYSAAERLLALDQHLSPRHPEAAAALGQLATLLAAQSPKSVRYVPSARPYLLGRVEGGEVAGVIARRIPETSWRRDYLTPTTVQRHGQLPWLVDEGHGMATPLTTGGHFESPDDEMVSHYHHVTALPEAV